MWTKYTKLKKFIEKLLVIFQIGPVETLEKKTDVATGTSFIDLSLSSIDSDRRAFDHIQQNTSQSVPRLSFDCSFVNGAYHKIKLPKTKTINKLKNHKETPTITVHIRINEEV